MEREFKDQKEEETGGVLVLFATLDRNQDKLRRCVSSIPRDHPVFLGRRKPLNAEAVHMCGVAFDSGS